MKVYSLNGNMKDGDRLVELLRILITDCTVLPQLASLDCKIMLLYNCLKLMLGVKQLSKFQEETLLEFYESFGVKTVKKY